MRYVCTCNEDLCNADCNSCRQLCDMQAGPLKEDVVEPEVKSKDSVPYSLVVVVEPEVKSKDSVQSSLVKSKTRLCTYQ